MSVGKEGEPGLTPLQPSPENLESPVNAIDSWVTPNHFFFVRNHFKYPEVGNWILTVDGEVNCPLNLDYESLRRMPQVSRYAILECSGNKRGLLQPKVPGEQWETGAVGNAKWTGIPLQHVLLLTGLKPTVKEVVFSGSDFGTRPDMPGLHYFARSLPLAQALSPETLLVLDMNDKPLPFKHGFPLRLLVPGWFGMASVKWLNRITPINTAFTGPFQVIDYVYLPSESDYRHARPVTEIKISSIITRPSHMEILPPGQHTIRGITWAGRGIVTRVEVSTDGGGNWSTATLTQPRYPVFTWTFWEYSWNVETPGRYSLAVRAIDSKGRYQPYKAAWNAKGYGNNSIHKVTVEIPKPVMP